MRYPWTIGSHAGGADKSLCTAESVGRIWPPGRTVFCLLKSLVRLTVLTISARCRGSVFASLSSLQDERSLPSS